MAFDPKKLSNDIKELNKMIDQMYKKLGRRDTPPVFKASEISAARREIKKLDEDLNSTCISMTDDRWQGQIINLIGYLNIYFILLKKILF